MQIIIILFIKIDMIFNLIFLNFFILSKFEGPRYCECHSRNRESKIQKSERNE